MTSAYFVWDETMEKEDKKVSTTTRNSVAGIYIAGEKIGRPYDIFATGINVPGHMTYFNKMNDIVRAMIFPLIKAIKGREFTKEEAILFKQTIDDIVSRESYLVGLLSLFPISSEGVPLFLSYRDYKFQLESLRNIVDVILRSKIKEIPKKAAPYVREMKPIEGEREYSPVSLLTRYLIGELWKEDPKHRDDLLEKFTNILAAIPQAAGYASVFILNYAIISLAYGRVIGVVPEIGNRPIYYVIFPMGMVSLEGTPKDLSGEWLEERFKNLETWCSDTKFRITGGGSFKVWDLVYFLNVLAGNELVPKDLRFMPMILSKADLYGNTERLEKILKNEGPNKTIPIRFLGEKIFPNPTVYEDRIERKMNMVGAFITQNLEPYSDLKIPPPKIDFQETGIPDVWFYVLNAVETIYSRFPKALETYHILLTGEPLHDEETYKKKYRNPLIVPILLPLAPHKIGKTCFINGIMDYLTAQYGIRPNKLEDYDWKKVRENIKTVEDLFEV